MPLTLRIHTLFIQLVLLALFLPMVQAQLPNPELYYTVATGDLNDTVNGQYLMTIDRETGETKRVSGFGFWGTNSLNWPPQIDEANRHYSFLARRPYKGQILNDGYHFVQVDLETGEAIKNFELPGAFWPGEGEVQSLLFDCRTSTYFGLKVFNDTADRGVELITIDPENEDVQSVGGGRHYLATDPPQMDLARNAMVFIGTYLGFFPQDDWRIFSIDLATGAIINDPVLDTEHFLLRLTYDCIDNKFYANTWREGDDVPWLVTVDPLTGITTPVGGEDQERLFPKQEDYALIDPIGHRFIVPNRGDAGLDVINEYDLRTGEPIHQTEVSPNRPFWWKIAREQTCYTNAQFSFENNCFGAPARFSSANRALGWEWDFGDPGSGESNTSLKRNPTHVFSDTGWFNVQLITHSCLETDSLTLPVYVNPYPTLDLGPDTLMCPGDSVVFTLPEIDTVEYTWGDGSVGNRFVARAFGPVTVVSRSAYCDVPGEVEILASPVAGLDLGGTAYLCPGGKDTLDASPFGETFVWNDGTALPRLLVTDTGLYSITVSDGICTNSDSITVLRSPPVPDPFPFTDTTICPEASYAVSLDTAYTYTWRDGVEGPARALFPPFNYTVTVTNTHGCTRIDEFSVLAHVVRNLTIASEDDTLVATEGFAPYAWSFAGIAIPGNATARQPELLIGTYTVAGRDENGCQANDTLNLPAVPCSGINVWPNPLKDELNLRAPRQIIEQVRLHDRKGGLMQDYTDLNSNEVHIRLPNFPATGLYLLEITTNQCKEVRKVVVGE